MLPGSTSSPNEINWQLARRKHALSVRAVILQAIRCFFAQRGYLEVDTPQRIPAPAPESHIDAIPADGWFLQTSPELCMKRLLAAGYERIFQISHCWRRGERGSKHLPELTLLEWYTAGADYRALMEDCEALLLAVADALHRGPNLVYQGTAIDLTPPWPRLAVREAFARYAHVSMEEALRRDEFDLILTHEIEPHLGIGKPTFICDYPAAQAALARLRPDDPSVAERVELYVAGLELANGFSELVDAAEQRERFVREEEYRRAQGRTPYPIAEKFLNELSNMPPSAGIALGVDRLVMLFLDAPTIDDVVPFTPEDL